MKKTKIMSSSAVSSPATFPKILFVVTDFDYKNSISVKTMSSSTSSSIDDFQDNISDYDSSNEIDFQYTPRNVTFYPFNKYIIIPSREELRSFQQDIWYTKSELREFANSRFQSSTTVLLPLKIDKVEKLSKKSKCYLPTLFPKTTMRSQRSCNDLVNLPSISK